MLQNLHVKNLALIEEAEVEFGPGLNILTGETGAGKSILLGSMNLALGQKVPKEILKDNGEPALVELSFTTKDEEVLEKLREYDIETDGENVLLSRKITSQKAVGRINGEAVSAAVLREISSLLLDIHGQHEHQSLLSKKKHLQILDAYLKDALENRKAELSEEYRVYRNLKQEWANSSLDAREREREADLLSFEVEEIEKANLRIGEDEELEQEFCRFSNGRKIMESIGFVNSAIGGEEGAALERIGRSLRELSMVASYDKEIEELADQLAEIENLTNDFYHGITAYIDRADFDEETFYKVELRLDQLNHIKSKYGKTMEAVLQSYEEKCARLEVLKDYDAYVEKLKKDLEEAEKKVRLLCEQISQIRKAGSKELCASIRDALKDLNFLDVEFEMEFPEPSEYTANGYDEPEFVISTNPGEPKKPLGKVASGGELSRIMLAIKTVMADADEIETLIFDEIDSGISGRTAQMVAEKMNLLGRNHQIICITHLPQIAAMADEHFLIHKSVENNATHTNIDPLDEKQSILELARMLGGVEITDSVVKNAQEMKELAHMKK